MPYVVPEIREGLRPDPLHVARNPGELQFQVACLVDDFVTEAGLRYATCNDVLGALDGASREFYRRIVAPYEDKKIVDNGDVYTVGVS